MTGAVRRPHPWNHEFVWRDHPGPFATITAAQAEAFDRDGFFVMDRVFDAAEVEAIRDAIAPGDAKIRELLAMLPGGRISVAGLDTQVVAPHLVCTSEHLRRVCAHPTLVGVCADLMGPDVRLYWEQSVAKQPNGAAPVLWHQDNGYTYVEPQDYLTCWIALTDATPDNGCIEVMPGAHRAGTLAHRETDIGFECWGDHDTAVVVPARAGDVVVFSSLTPHATRVNTTDEVREAYIVQYAHDGAVGRLPNTDGSPGARAELDEPTRQFVVLRDGRPVAPPLLT
jgi:ectoine hydroxylase-related dioxygenase (phytanoyl-CoA dioxygenase family)